MMRASYSRLAAVMLGGILLVPWACVSTPEPRMYILKSLDAGAAEKRVETETRDMALGIGPVTIPGYLDRPQMVTQGDRNQLEIAEFDRWSEPLKDSLPRLLGDNLSNLLSTERVYVFPWRRSTSIDYQIIVDVTRFEGEVGWVAVLAARWAVLDKDGKKVLLNRRSSLSRTAETNEYAALVGALNHLIGELSRDIADAIKGISG